MLTPRALVTGGAGFIGSHVSAALLAAGQEVVIIDDLSSGKRANIPDGAQFEHLDIRSSDAATIVREGRFDTLVHLAAQLDVRKSVADPVADASINIVGTLNLLEATRAASRRPRVVFASSGGAIYGDAVEPPNVETFEKNPESPYAIAKLSVEYYLAYYARVHGLDTVALRFANVFGPRQDPHGEAGVVAIFCERILARRGLTVFGDGEQTRDYVYIEDVVRAVQLAASASLPAPVKLDERGFNIGTSVPTSVLTIAATLKQIAGSDVAVEFAPKRAGEQQRSFVSIEKAARLLEWAPQVTLEAGLSATFRWFQSHS
jgi:UDP-glucose 4-epimerase